MLLIPEMDTVFSAINFELDHDMSRLTLASAETVKSLIIAVSIKFKSLEISPTNFFVCRDTFHEERF